MVPSRHERLMVQNEVEMERIAYGGPGRIHARDDRPTGPAERAGFSDWEIAEIFNAAVERLKGPGDVPYARGTCTECGAVRVGC